MARRKTNYKRRPTRKPARRMTMSRSRLFLPYPLIIFLLLCVGVLLVGWTLKAGADNISVRAKIPAPLPTTAATIDVPASGTHFSSVPIAVSGTCPSNSYVAIYRTGFFSGTAICQADNTYHLSIDLFPGTNDLVAHVYNVTDDEGPVSPETVVYYDVPQQPTTNPVTPTGGPTIAVEPLILKIDHLYRGYYVNQEVSLDPEIHGGKGPYAINVNWGDKASSLISVVRAGKFSAQHKYSAPGGYKGIYSIEISASDSEGRSTFLEIFLAVNPKNAPAAGTTGPTKPVSFFSSHQYLLKYIWPTYGIVSLMSISFLLGEKEEFLVIRKGVKLFHRRA